MDENPFQEIYYPRAPYLPRYCKSLEVSRKGATKALIDPTAF